MAPGGPLYLLTPGGAPCSKKLCLLFSSSKWPLQVTSLRVGELTAPSGSVILKYFGESLRYAYASNFAKQ